ncbi:unnamed protein product [Urochloa humidicola]
MQKAALEASDRVVSAAADQNSGTGVNANALFRLQKYIFIGPVLCVKKFTTESEAVELANDTHYGLAGAVISNDQERCERITKHL